MNYGEFGGQYVPQELISELNKIVFEFEKCKEDEGFNGQESDRRTVGVR